MISQSSYQLERQVAVAAVLQASIITRTIHDQLIRSQNPIQHSGDRNQDQVSILKLDRSPVTVGDYTVQALVNFIISKYFPDDEIVGEEDSSELLNDGDHQHLHKIVQFTNQALNQDRLSTETDEGIWRKYRNQESLDRDRLIELIDMGKSSGARHGRTGRFWTLDPIDGTKGFLRGGQYAVCLALIVDGEVVLGVIGTPNLPVLGPLTSTDKQPTGVLFLAERGSGAFQRALEHGEYTRVQMRSHTPESLAANGSFCESFESAHSDQSLTADIASRLKMVNAQNPIRIDSQAKYCALARGDSDVYFRFPTRPDYQEKIWDHAAGNIMITESGGKVTDLNGKTLDFSCGRTLSNNHQGFLACHSNVFDLVLKSVQDVAKLHQKL